MCRENDDAEQIRFRSRSEVETQPARGRATRVDQILEEDEGVVWGSGIALQRQNIAGPTVRQ